MNRSNNIVITGVSSGIGFACTKRFINKGYTVFGSVRKPEDSESAKQLFKSGLFHPLILDITDEDSVKHAAEIVKQKINGAGVACLINNAGVAVSGPLMHISGVDMEKQFATNVLGTMNVTRAFLPLLGAERPCSFEPGKIINVSSVSGKISYPFLGPYAASKHALEALSAALRRELAIYGINVLVVAPGSVQSEIWKKNSFDLIIKKYGSTDWAGALKQFNVDENTFMKADRIAEKIWKIHNNKNFRVHYPVVNNYIKNWLLPRLLPARILDIIIQKTLKLRRLP
ncbi:MAG: SDR family oxidoreductase [Calditrichaeota bacterium]|nr:SDR family oxidoreductase [Calditrichota bacterium]